MQHAIMNKLARPACTACAGMGKIRVPRSMDTLAAGLERNAQPAGQGFIWVVCEACNGERVA